MLKYEIDDLDCEILERLQADGRKAFIEIARELSVSGGSIHQRVDKMTAAGIIRGSKVILDHAKMGIGVTVLLGIHLARSNVLPSVL